MILKSKTIPALRVVIAMRNDWNTAFSSLGIK